MAVTVSSPDRIMFPDRDYTKADLVGYYDRVSEQMLPMLLGRPLTLHRFPQGVGGKGFMQKNVAKHFPPSIDRFEVPRQEGGITTYPIVTEAEHVPWLANQGTITFHIWTSRQPELGHPDWMVLDLDPAADGSDVHAVAEVGRNILDEFGLQSHPVATGSKGFHLWVALEPGQEWGRVALTNRALAGLVVTRRPDIATTEFLKRDRKGRVFVDWLRANRGATVVAPFSVRARPNASVAVPLDWDEVVETAPDQWTINDVDDLTGRPNLDQRATERFELPTDDIVNDARSAGVDMDTPFDRFGRKP